MASLVDSAVASDVASLVAVRGSRIERRKNQLVQNAIRAGRGAGTVFVADLYVARAASYDYYGGLWAWELTGRTV